MIDGGIADADIPALGLGQSREQAITRRHKVVGHFELAGVDVDGDDLAPIAGLHQRADLLLVHLLAAAGVLFAGILALGHCSAPLAVLSGWGLLSLPDGCARGGGHSPWRLPCRGEGPRRTARNCPPARRADLLRSNGRSTNINEWRVAPWDKRGGNWLRCCGRARGSPRRTCPGWCWPTGWRS